MTLKEATEKAARYCARQERCHQQVRDKLYQWGAHREQVEEVIAELITKDFLNEQRFAEAYAIGKFRQNGWGRRKIEQGMRQKRLSERCIELGLAAIDGGEYEEKLRDLAKKRYSAARGKTARERALNTVKYLLSRGYSVDLARRTVDRISSALQ